ncbi:MAG: hypothetical protein WKF75_06630 [Singulisphaera sp.]
MIQDERWLRSGVLAMVGTAAARSCCTAAASQPPPSIRTTYAEQKKEVDNVRMKEHGRTSLVPGKSKPISPQAK